MHTRNRTSVKVTVLPLYNLRAPFAPFRAVSYKASAARSAKERDTMKVVGFKCYAYRLAGLVHAICIPWRYASCQSIEPCIPWCAAGVQMQKKISQYMHKYLYRCLGERRRPVQTSLWEQNRRVLLSGRNSTSAKTACTNLNFGPGRWYD